MWRWFWRCIFRYNPNFVAIDTLVLNSYLRVMLMLVIVMPMRNMNNVLWIFNIFQAAVVVHFLVLPAPLGPPTTQITMTTTWIVCIMSPWRLERYHFHDDVIKWKHFPRYWQFVRRIHRSPVNSPHKGQWRGALMFSLICTRLNVWVNNGEAGDLRRDRAHYGVTVMIYSSTGYPMNVHMFCVAGILSFFSDSVYSFSTHPIQGCFTGNGAIQQSTLKPLIYAAPN